jgi:hypothetical protein
VLTAYAWVEGLNIQDKITKYVLCNNLIRFLYNQLKLKHSNVGGCDKNKVEHMSIK